MRSFNAGTIPLDHFAPRIFFYPPINLGVKAFQVTERNIGALVVDFQTDLEYDGDGNPYFYLIALRDANIVTGQENYVRKHVTIGVWIVMMRGELHVFHDREFHATFAETAYTSENDPSGGIWPEKAKIFEKISLEAPAHHPEPCVAAFRLGAKVTMPGDLLGEVMDGPNDRQEYWVEFDDGQGADWFHESQLRLNMGVTPPKPETEHIQ